MSERCEYIEALGADVRESDADYEGTVRRWGDSARVIVTLDGSRYAAQRPCPTGDGVKWLGRGDRSLSALLAKRGGAFPGLAEACVGLPELPRDAAPEFLARRDALLRLFGEYNVARSDYLRVVEQDGNMRLAVSSDGSRYLIQWISRAQYLGGVRDEWKTQITGTTSGECLRKFLARTYSTHDWGRVAAPDLVRALHQVPERACDGRWAPLPAIPGL